MTVRRRCERLVEPRSAAYDRFGTILVFPLPRPSAICRAQPPRAVDVSLPKGLKVLPDETSYLT